MLHSVAIDYDQCGVPLIRRLHDPSRRRIERVVSTRGGQPALTVRMTGVVEKLILGRAPVDVVIILGAAIKNTRVAGRAEFPIERQLEVSELVSRDDVAD